ncbi:MAG: hypothetical protein MJZ41_13335 [Bacteroidaceae bacterium]|nr:hypothetical protein [Bacteroidaceae bacterium]
MTQEEELAIIRPWAAAMPEKYDYIYLFKTINGVNYYHLYHKLHIGHRCGIPELAFVKDGIPILMENDDDITIVLVS